MYSILRQILIITFLLLAYMAALAAYLLPYGWAVGLVIAAAMLCRKTYRYTAYGTARWAKVYPDLARAKMLDGDGDGLAVGLIEAKVTRTEGIKALFDRHLSARRACEMCLAAFQRKKPQQMVRLNRSHHVSIYAPTGAGKNVSIVEPFLFSSPESCAVIDVKGENCQLTSKHRELVLNQKIIRLDPWKLTTATPSAWNVLDLIDPTDPESLDQIRALADAIVEKHPNERDIHWTQKSEKFIGGVIAAVVYCCPPEHRNLQVVAKIMANKALLAKAISDLCQCEAHGGLVAQIGHEMSVSIARKEDGSFSNENKELDGILSTANRSLTFLSTPAVAESTKASRDCDLTDLYRENGATIYWIIPLHFLSSHAPLLRLWLTAFMQFVVKRGIGNKRTVYAILDECATALEGHGKTLEQMLAVGRGYGLKVIAIFQSMSQLKKLFPEGQEGTLLGNTSHVFFAIGQDQQMCEFASSRLGECTQVVTSGGTSASTSWSQSGSQQGGGSSSYSGSKSWNDNWQQAARKLLKPEEVAGLNERVALIFTPGVPPIATWLPRYYEGRIKTGLSPLKLWIDAAGLFFLAAAAAAWVTAALYFGTFQTKGGTYGEGESGFYQPAETWPGATDRGAPGRPGRHEGVRGNDEGDGREGLGWDGPGR